MNADSISALNGATALTTKDDGDIRKAWQRYTAARQAYSDLPHVPCPPGTMSTPAEDEQTDIMDEAEKVIGGSIANTVRGVEIMLWLLLHDHADDNPSALAANGEELEWCAENGDFNGFDRLIIPAIRSLQAMRIVAEKGGEK